MQMSQYRQRYSTKSTFKERNFLFTTQRKFLSSIYQLDLSTLLGKARVCRFDS